MRSLRLIAIPVWPKQVRLIGWMARKFRIAQNKAFFPTYQQNHWAPFFLTIGTFKNVQIPHGLNWSMNPHIHPRQKFTANGFFVKVARKNHSTFLRSSLAMILANLKNDCFRSSRAETFGRSWRKASLAADGSFVALSAHFSRMKEGVLKRAIGKL